MYAELLDWYNQNKRILPWRLTKDPYKIWISEIMLQQTQVTTVVEYYNRFIGCYPNVFELAKADEQEVLKLWEGLGYYSRARNLHKCARTIVEEYQGVFPKHLEALKRLPGIGPYTAGAISSIAFNQKSPAVDGNVMRVFSRVYHMKNDISLTASRGVFEEKVLEVMREDAGHFNQALMDLGATICTPKAPKCAQCPLNLKCLSGQNHDALFYPIKSKKISKKHEQVAVLVLIFGQKILIQKRTDEALLNGLWGFPVVSKAQEKDEFSTVEIKHEIFEKYGLTASKIQKAMAAKHVFTHLVWHMDFYFVKIENILPIDYPIVEWINAHDFSHYPLPTAFNKIINDQFYVYLNHVKNNKTIENLLQL